MSISTTTVKLLLFILVALPSGPLGPSLMGGPVSVQATGNRAAEMSEDATYRYYFINEKFIVSHQEVLIDGEGRGRYRFKKRDMEEMTLDFKVSPRVLGEIRGLIDQLAFLSTEESFQHKKDFSHLGTMSIRIRRGTREREASFNYTDNTLMNQLVQIFRGLTVQENRIFEMELVRATDPISMPAQLRFLEGELKSRSIADPPRFRPMLTELKSDESVPLIARNHAERLLQMIEKSK
ncbi:MAG: hypothetical protein ACK562_16170 [Acidobacteriota bacterium]